MKNRLFQKITSAIIPSNKDSIACVTDEIQDLIRRNNLKVVFKMDYPKYKEIPEEAKLALIVALKHGLTVSFTLAPDNLPANQEEVIAEE